MQIRKLLVLTIAAGALAVPAATAAPTHGKPSGPKPCHGKAKVTVVLKGTLANVDALALNDQVVVKAKASRCDLLTSGTSPPALTAKMVVVQTPEA